MLPFIAELCGDAAGDPPRDAHPDINRVVGDFTSLLLVADRPQPGESWLERARRNASKAWRAVVATARDGSGSVSAVGRAGSICAPIGQ